MMTITFLVFGLTAAAFVLVMTDWTGIKGKQECFKYKMINRQLQKHAEEIAERQALEARYNLIVSKGYTR